MSTSTTYKYLEPNPRSSYRQLFIKGTRLRARVLYGHYKSAEEPRTIEEIAADYNLPVEAVREAIAYCDSKPPEIELDQRREDALIEASGMNDPRYKLDPKGTYRHLTDEQRAEIRRRFGG
jgi:uncharacterized protein (DUF433 family)